ncbi:DUF305 domain-containing protein [Brevundimonas aurifodinae]|uniref:DUF305 domain-containing protein n=2 Tax=Brevundimonas TaxID=41275 RepID=A0ABV1NMN8_9CAUL|nr:MAG: hypothetical protein B7Z42_15265 [Brevundimonas sp. 12-68-7]OYX36090.1 MAG: hypothetical protein B7Z01_00070 [Brevundimonas subvibrioides]
MRTTASAALLLSVLALAGCEGGGDPVDQARQEALTANRAAAHPIDPAMLADAEAPPAASARSVGDQAFVVAMIDQHRETIVAAEAALSQSSDPEIQRLARSIIDARSREITELQTWKPAAR